MNMVRTRFAPSPTGYLHIGGARTALYCWLFARKMKGSFILRIEDTDQARSTATSVQAILEGMKWLGLQYDEGPFYQTARFDRYLEVAQQLLEENKAYRCYCSKERLDKLRETQLANQEKPRYDGLCRHNPSDATQIPHVIRFKNPQEGEVTFHDLVRGEVTFNNAELDDLIIVRSDGSPTYNFTVVIDDWDMQISHVIRGDDHINNTPRQINILKALGASLPTYAHLPMILGSDGKRLSKRHDAVNLLEYREAGFLPHALLNYLVRLGWSHGNQEIFSLSELIEYFDLQGLNRSAAALNKEKLIWLNQHYLKTENPIDLVKEFTWQLEKLDIHPSSGPPPLEVILIQQSRTKTLKEMAEQSRFFYQEILWHDNLIKLITPEIRKRLTVTRDHLQALTLWTKEEIHLTLNKVAETESVKLGEVAQPLRLVLTGSKVSPPIDTTMVLLKKERVLQRINNALAL